MNEYVEEKVKMPAIAMMVVGALSILTNLIGLGWQGFTAVMLILATGAGNMDWLSFITGQGLGVLSYLVAFLVSFIVLAAGSRLKAARSPGLVYAGSIMSILPCCLGVPCCCIGLPVGIWAIVTMQDEQVKAAFE